VAAFAQASSYRTASDNPLDQEVLPIAPG